MDKIFNKILLSFTHNENLIFTDEEFHYYDDFIDAEIAEGNLIKCDEYNFRGVKFVDKIDKINKKLSSKIVALYPHDSRIDMRCKGQAAYFLVNNEIAILTFSTNALTFFPPK